MVFGHYTSTSALISILENQKLWATNIKFLNDQNEFIHALDFVTQMIDKPKFRHKLTSTEIPIFDSFLDDLNNKLPLLDSIVADYLFTLSFSEKTDLLSQWRGYCLDNQGYCITYDLQALLADVQREFPESKLIKCVYQDSEKRELLAELLNGYWRKYKNAEEVDRIEIIVNFIIELSFLASYCKHQSFEEESEYRIIISLSVSEISKMKFRQGKFSVVPYLEVPALISNIRSVCIGPTINSDLCFRGLNLLIQKCTGDVLTVFSKIDLRTSGVPYRV